MKYAKEKFFAWACSEKDSENFLFVPVSKEAVAVGAENISHRLVVQDVV